MKNLKILVVVLLAIGLATAGSGCGSSSGSSSGSQVSSGLNALPPANLTVSNVGSAASQAIDGANVQPPSDVSSITSSTVSNVGSPSIPTLSYMVNNLGSKNVIVKPQSMKGNVVNGLAIFKQAATSGSCLPTSYSSTGGSGTVNVTATWNNVSCTMSTTTLTINGTISVTGTYDTTLGSVNITETENISFNESDPTSGTIAISLNGSETITAAGIVAGATSVTYAEKGKANISATITSPNGSGSVTGWIDIDDTFTGTPNQLVYAFKDGTEISSGGAKFGTYGIGTITMTTSGSPVTAITVNGGGTYGVTTSSGTSYYSGKVSVAYANIVFDPGVCSGYPSAGTLTVTANNTFVFTFDGQSCGCAMVSENGGTATQDCSIY